MPIFSNVALRAARYAVLVLPALHCGKLTATRMQSEAHVWICCRGARLVSLVQSKAKLEMVKKASTFYFLQRRDPQTTRTPLNAQAL